MPKQKSGVILLEASKRLRILNLIILSSSIQAGKQQPVNHDHIGYNLRLHALTTVQLAGDTYNQRNWVIGPLTCNPTEMGDLPTIVNTRIINKSHRIHGTALFT